MDYERYISDGILEKHLLGFATPEEEAELQIHINIFPELQEEMNAVERSIERAALRDAPLPPHYIKKAIMRQIAKEQAAQHISEQHRDVEPPVGRMTVHIGWKILLISLLSMIALSLLAAVLFFMASR
jgi:hypothetical protein